MTTNRRPVIRMARAGSFTLGALGSSRAVFAECDNDEEDNSTGDRFVTFIYAGIIDALDTAAPRG